MLISFLRGNSCQHFPNVCPKLLPAGFQALGSGGLGIPLGIEGASAFPRENMTAVGNSGVPAPAVFYLQLLALWDYKWLSVQ